MKDYPEEETTKSWVKTANVIKKHSDAMVDQWNKEIDGLLTFVSPDSRRRFVLNADLFQAGLFSAILTAFNVQSYQLLQPPPADQSMAVILRLSAAFSHLAASPACASAIPLALDSAPNSFIAPVEAVLLNICWFTGLVFSLASATLGIIIKQWLKEFSMGLYGSSREISRRRQYRVQKLEKWKVSFIVSMLPLLLQVALVLFFVGLLILLSTIHRTVTIVVATFACILLALMLLAAVLPAFAKDFCYYSPQSYCVFLLVEWMKGSVRRLAHVAWAAWAKCRRRCRRIRVGDSENQSDHSKTAVPGDEIWWQSNPSGNPSSWKDGELDAAAKDSIALDGDIVFKAYDITLDAAYFKDAERCLVDIGSRQLANKYIHHAHDTLNKHWEIRDLWPQDALRLFQDLVVCAMRIGLAFPSDLSEDGLEPIEEWLEWEIVRDWVAGDMMWLLSPSPAPGSTARWPPCCSIGSP